MPPRRQAAGGPGRSSGRGRRRAGQVAGVVAAAVLVSLLAAGADRLHSHRAEIKRFFSNPPSADPALVEAAIEEAYERIAPAKVSASRVTIAAREIRQDRVVLPKNGSLLRANAEITGAVERAGGEVAYGTESADEKGRKIGVTLGVSVRKNLVREIKIEKITKK